MAYTPTTPELGIQPIAVTSTVKNHPFGTIVKAVDPTYGEGEFIYLLGVASTIVGSVVVFAGNSSGTPTWQTALVPDTAGLGQPVAVAMSANGATGYGWYQISGMAVVAENATFTADAAIYISSTVGKVSTTQANGKEIVNARSIVADASGLGVAYICRPFAQGQAV